MEGKKLKVKSAKKWLKNLKYLLKKITNPIMHNM